MKHISKLIILLAFLVSSTAWGADDTNARWNFENAIQEGNIKNVQTLIKSGVSVNIAYSSYFTPLYLAVYYNQPEIVKLLLASGAQQSINAQETTSRYTALITAVSRNQVNLVNILLEAGADVNLQTTRGDTALHWAVNNHNRQMVLDLIDAGADVTIRDNKGVTPLMKAVGFHDKFTAHNILNAQSTIIATITSIKPLSLSTIKLNWTVNDNVPQAFQVEYSNNLSGPWRSYNIAGNSRSMIFINLKPGKIYHFRIKGKSDDNWGEYSQMGFLTVRGR